MPRMNRKAARRDSNEPDIVSALVKAGATVMKLSDIGYPDLLVGYKKPDGTPVNMLLEVKTAKGVITEDQQKFIDKWQGVVYVVRSAEQALEILNL